MDWDKHFQSVELLLPLDSRTDFSRIRNQIIFGDSFEASPSHSINGYSKSGYFAGPSDSLNGVEIQRPLITGAQDFTFEGWVFPTHIDSEPRYIFSERAYGQVSNGRFAFNITATRELQLFVGHTSGDIFLNGTTSLPVNQWSHVALTRESGTFRIWLNGHLEAEQYSDYLLGIFGPPSTYVGRYANSFPERRWEGFMQDIRVTNLARYTAPFTSPGRLTTPVMLAMVQDDADYLKAASLGVLAGNATTASGLAVDRVDLIADEGYLIGRIEPASNGDWSASVMSEPHHVIYFADGCQPVIHGPYMPEAQ